MSGPADCDVDSGGGSGDGGVCGSEGQECTGELVGSTQEDDEEDCSQVGLVKHEFPLLQIFFPHLVFQECEGSSSCHFYTFYYDGGFCLLYNDCELEDCEGCVSSQPDC